MLLTSSEMLSILYSAAYWLLPRLVLLALIYVVVRAAVRAEFKRAKHENETNSKS